MPNKSISIDEELLLFKGRLSFKQYIPSKRSRYGIKIFSLCEDTGYLYNSQVYLGKHSDAAPDDVINQLGKTGAIVVNLMEHLLGKGYQLYLDNWYTSEAIFRYLLQNNTVAAGTVKKNRMKLPETFKSTKLEKGEHIFRRCEDMLVVKLQDKKEVFMLSTMHQANTVNTGKRDSNGDAKSKLQLIDDYNRKMGGGGGGGGVDKNDAMIGYYSPQRKT